MKIVDASGGFGGRWGIYVDGKLKHCTLGNLYSGFLNIKKGKHVVKIFCEKLREVNQHFSFFECNPYGT